MSGAAIVAELLRADPAIVPAIATLDRIMLARLKDDTKLTALLIRTISAVERQPLKVGTTVRVTERVSVTVRAASYRDQKTALRLVRSCCHGRTGDIGGGARVSIRSAGTGPDVSGPGNSFEQAQDFRVSFEEPA